EKQLIEAESRRTRLGIELKAKQARLNAGESALPVSDAEVEAALNRIPEVSQLIQKKEQVERELAAAEGRITNAKEDPGMKPYYERRDALQAELDGLRRRHRSQVAEDLRSEGGRGLAATVRELQGQYDDLKEYEGLLNK